MAVVSSCREMLGCPQRAQPLSFVASTYGGNSRETAGDKPEEGGDDVKSSWPRLTRATHVLQWRVQRAEASDSERIPKARRSPDWSLQLDSHEVGIR